MGTKPMEAEVPSLPEELLRRLERPPLRRELLSEPLSSPLSPLVPRRSPRSLPRGTARFSTSVMPDGTAITMRGRIKRLRSCTFVMK